MKKGTKALLILLIGLLLATNAFTFIMYTHEKNAAEAAAEETAAQEAESKTDKSKKRSDTAGSTAAAQAEPLIAVVDYDTEDAHRISDKLTRAGLGNEIIGSIDALDVDKFDAIIIPGGHSVDPEMYGAERDPRTKNTDIEKDRFQFEAVRMFVDAEKPVLGICRGEQLVNNVLGGTTIQHMEEGWHKKNRTVRVAEGTWLYDLMGGEPVTYHYHHQCVDKLGDGLYATQWDPDSGHIEAYEHKTLPVYGLQWHPDSMDEEGVRVFESFGDIVREDMRKRAAQ